MKHVEQGRGEIGGQVGPRRSDADRRDLDRIGQVEHGGGVVAVRRPGELAEEVFVARHAEAEHGRGRQRSPLRLEPPQRFALGTVRHPHDHRQTETGPHVPPGDPPVVCLPLRLDRLDRLGADRQRLRLPGHEHGLRRRADPQAVPGQPPEAPGGLEQSGKRIGVDLARFAEHGGRLGARPDGVPRLLAREVVAVHGLAAVLPQHPAGSRGMVPRPPQVALGHAVGRHAGRPVLAGHRRARRPGDEDREYCRQKTHFRPHRPVDRPRTSLANGVFGTSGTLSPSCPPTPANPHEILTAFGSPLDRKPCKHAV
jgi:hypothetical protein